ncbi:hypothetical protein [uncultured Parabacteroides sp.]|uniref:hypothetical protein n=1 Tax=uncultured Parabacteroides sp. TaxID=512312 RepID=UPI00262BBD90|nr:hypothetical protein [uncultured Parabacteroides sp.]
MKLKFFIFCLAIASVCSCRVNKPSDLGAFYSFETECIGTEYDGSLTLRVWGGGNSKSDALNQAMKKAVHDVIFKGIVRGVNDYNMRPLVLEANGAEKYQDYFNRFFADKGDYTYFVNLKDEKPNSRQVMENKQVYKYGVTVRVLRSELKQRLQQDGIIK